MSGSYDRPTGRRDQASQPASSFDLYDTVLTGPAGPDDRYTYEHVPTSPLDATPARKFAPSRGRKPKAESGNTPVVPPDSVTGRSLTLVISIMCFLACLTAGAVYMINESASAWLNDIASEVTVQVEPRSGLDMEKTLRDAETFLRSHAGVTKAVALSLDTSAKLLEPWLGHSDVLASLPVPRLIAVEVDRSAPPNIDELRTELTKRFPSASLDDHRRWQRQIRTVTRSFALGGLAILLLVGAATTAIIVSATRSALASNREIVEVLHFVGATDRYIAREFERHFLRLGIRAGLVGALSAMAVFVSMPSLLEMLGGGPTTTAEMHRMIGTGGLDGTGYVLLVGVVVVISALCMLTSRYGVFRIINSKA
ncbi:MAG: ABC transporter permease [Hyphomicrobium sp.]|jgi:cell division transport system permease protein